MKEEEIRKYAELMRELDLTSLSVSEEGVTVCLKKAHGVNSAPSPARNELTDSNAAKDKDLISITSPMVGMFYSAPAENADPFVSVGDAVREGDILCIIEAMKLMNEIRAEEGGIIERICVTNGQVVEYGTELMRIRKG